ncbi:MAG TPA: TIGR02757 family protein [Lacibacter sp.]|nr:TIGR02757 family protein [Lacibacter sp.]HMO88450.1 TIGR02757 family protein [Lacibacter sp.]HMP87812.1 TIGR02757 family protein [Lacibacter sp.]
MHSSENDSGKRQLKAFLNKKARFYEQPSFIPADPICIPHLFQKKQDIEIAGLFAAIFAWGNRTTIINKSKELMQLMEMQPHAFCLQAGPAELKRLAHFKHRTFNADDLYYFIEFFRDHYRRHASLETAFFPGKGMSVEAGLNHFRTYFFRHEHLKRTEKHIASPAQHSSCKRLNMYLRWMVRKNDRGVDFGCWKRISPADLICPLDVHVARVARQLGLLQRKQSDWQAALELTERLRIFDAHDPVKYDFALFGMGVMEKAGI